MKEKVLDALRELGFIPEPLEDSGWYEFYYEGKNFIYLYNSEDENFLSISIPGLFDYDEDEVDKFFMMVYKLNSAPKYVKAYKFGNSLWLFYERELFEDEDLPRIISHMIMQLDAAWHLGMEFKAGLEADNEAGGDEDEQEDDEAFVDDVEIIEETEETDC